MTELSFSSDELVVSFKFLTSLAIGLLLGLQRQRTPGAKAGLRTFALVALFATASALIADVTQSYWIIGAGLALAGLMIISAYHHHECEPGEADSGTTTVIAVLLCYGLGVMVWYDRIQIAVSIGIVATALLHFKTELHGLTRRLSSEDVASILQFAVLSFVILPLLPDEGFDRYRVLNPYHIWLMVVLVSGVSLAGYLALRLIGSGKSLALVGVFGGLVSSTATTLVYARQGAAHPAMVPIGGTIVGISNLVVLARLAVMTGVVAPGALPVMLPVLASGFVLGLAPLVPRLRTVMAAPQTPELDNPTNLRVALGFGALYAVILFAAAWLSERAGSHGLYAIAAASGFVDVDAITLSSLNLLNSGAVGAGVAVAAVAIAFASNAAVKLAMLFFIGNRELFLRCLPTFGGSVAGVLAGMLLFV